MLLTNVLSAVVYGNLLKTLSQSCAVFTCIRPDLSEKKLLQICHCSYEYDRLFERCYNCRNGLFVIVFFFVVDSLLCSKFIK